MQSIKLRDLLKPSTHLQPSHSLDPRLDSLAGASQPIAEIALTLKQISQGLEHVVRTGRAILYPDPNDPQIVKEATLKLLRTAQHDLGQLIADLEDVRLPR